MSKTRIDNRVVVNGRKNFNDADNFFVVEEVMQAHKESDVSFNAELVLAEVATATQATLNKWLPVNVSSGAVTVTEPSTPAGGWQAGQWFGVIDSRSNAATNNITVDLTANFYGASADDTISTDEAAFKYVYINSTVGFVRI